eukprot:gene23720-29973_t
MSRLTAAISQQLNQQHWRCPRTNLSGFNLTERAKAHKDKVQVPGYATFVEKGAVYSGEMKDNKKHGLGVLAHKNIFCAGNWVDNKMTGYGIKKVGNTVKCGMFVDDNLSGQGMEIRSTYHDENETYSGDFMHGRREGRGTTTYPNGNVYTGQHEGGMPNGQGTMRYTSAEDMDLFDGHWEHGSVQGYGVKSSRVDGTVYTGQFTSNSSNPTTPLLNGKGTFSDSEGVFYVGDFKDGESCGQGRLTEKDGTCIEGTFKDNEPNGHCKQRYYDNNMVIEGCFMDGLIRGNGTVNDGKGNIVIGELGGADGEIGNVVIRRANGTVEVKNKPVK